ncbi:protein tesmin/TSO1-like CXC 2 [Melia azedarach]|uniref:Protein tesmin/TSO1-like CXC 2 n=1 Tax=Melia azedarach TaxID=155640 RepID=A0ACC1Y7S7_MELAZ|nr:protein tesmin/TSO1-like CXC 2 [Melia azedarach]
MDTPDKNRIAIASLSKFEDSPVFNYISSLSPIEQIKSINTDNSFNSVAFTSPSSLFATPKINSLRESRFLLSSNQSPDILKPELHGKENKTSKGNSEAVRLSEHCTEKLGCPTPGSSVREVVSKLIDENLELTIELPKTMKYGGRTPVSERMSCDVKEASRGQEMAGASSSLVQSDESHVGEAEHFEDKSNLRKICRIEQSQEGQGSDWVSLISDAVLNSDLSIIENNSEDEDQKTVDTGEISFISTVLQLPQDNANDLTDMVSVSPSCSCKQSDMREPVTQPEEIRYLKDMDQTPDILSSNLLNKLVVSDPRAKKDNKEEKCEQSNCKQHNIRRRCLVFEMAGVHKKKAACEPNCRPSIPSKTDCKDAHAEKHLVPSKIKNCSSSMVAGVGLHLNALATTSKNSKVVKCETLASGRKLISMRSSLSSSLSLTSCRSLLNKSSALKSEERDPIPAGNEVKVVENAVQPSVIVACEEFDHSSPKRKRCKPEQNGESKACKRCNCKRSKCLKLYCECFAAGLYCVEPCSCLDCFNKPIYEDKVLETRRQIEFRNPLAFAPKVIRGTDSAVEFGDETNKTPASARHKKGCNCKRSSCLKKYCECFQGGVGCSISCRCEGCKNSFGRKDGAEESDYEGEDAEACEKNELDANISVNVVKEGEEEHLDLLLPSSDIPRAKRSGSSLLAVNPPPKLCISLKTSVFNQPSFEEHFQSTPENETPKILKNSFSHSMIPASPNSKRVSSPYHEIGSSTRYRSRRFLLRSSLSFPSVTPP